MARKIYQNINKGAFWGCLALSAVLIVASWCVPPYAIIDPSVLAAVGEIFAFAALGTVIEAIEKGSDISLTKGDTTVTIDNPDNNTGNGDTN